MKTKTISILSFSIMVIFLGQIMGASGYGQSGLFANPTNNIILSNGSITWTSSYIRFDSLTAYKHPYSISTDPIIVGYFLIEGLGGGNCAGYNGDWLYQETNTNGGSHTMSRGAITYDINPTEWYNAVFFAKHALGGYNYITFLSLVFRPNGAYSLITDGQGSCF